MTNLVPVPTAAAVLLKPLPPIDPLDAAILLGNIFGSQIEPALAQRVVAAACLLPDDPMLPDGVEGIQIGGRR